MYLNKLQAWTTNQKMILNEEKTKSRIFNFTKNKKFSTFLELNGKKVENVSEIKLLGTITNCLVKRAYAKNGTVASSKKFHKIPKIQNLNLQNIHKECFGAGLCCLEL